MLENFRDKTIEELEGEYWEALPKNSGSYLMETCHHLRKKALKEFTIEDTRIMISQDIGVLYILPIAIEFLKENIYAEGDYYEGDLLKAVLGIPKNFWISNKVYWQ